MLTYGCGYGSLTELAALYALKLSKTFARVMLRRQASFGFHPGAYTFVGGFQRFWERVGAHLAENGVELRLRSVVTRVHRKTVEDGEAEITISANGATSPYDRLLVTCPPNQILQFMDVTDEEQELFGRVSCFNYCAVVFRAEGIPENEVVAFSDNMERRRYGHLFLYISDWAGSRLFVGYQLNDTGKSETDLDALVRQDIAEMGGAVTEILLRRTWSYFPHSKLADLDQQYYPRLNALQGQKGTYYLGSIYAFETTDHCAEFAGFVVDKYFNP